MPASCSEIYQHILDYGVNDLGGTLLSENITRCAGGKHGQALTLDQMAGAIRRAGRTPVRRDTLYHCVGAAVQAH